MGGDIARLHLPVERAIRQEVQQFTTGDIILGIHQVEIAMDGIHDNAVWHTDLADLWRLRELGANHLMAAHIYDAIGNGVRHRHLTPLTTIEIKRIAHNTK